MTIAELKIRCGYGSIREGWAASVFIRPVAIYLTWLLVKLRFSANQATALGILCGVMGCALLGTPNDTAVLVGAAVYMLCLALDSSDGDLARFHRLPSVRGIYLDNLGHVVVIPLFELAIAMFLYWRFGRVELIIAGAFMMILARNAPWLALCETFTMLVEKNELALLNGAGEARQSRESEDEILAKALPAAAPWSDRLLDLVRPPFVHLVFVFAIAGEALAKGEGWIVLTLYAGNFALLLLLNGLRVIRNLRGDTVARYCRSRLERANRNLRT